MFLILSMISMLLGLLFIAFAVWAVYKKKKRFLRYILFSLVFFLMAFLGQFLAGKSFNENILPTGEYLHEKKQSQKDAFAKWSKDLSNIKEEIEHTDKSLQKQIRDLQKGDVNIADFKKILVELKRKYDKNENALKNLPIPQELEEHKKDLEKILDTETTIIKNKRISAVNLEEILSNEKLDKPAITEKILEFADSISNKSKGIIETIKEKITTTN